MNTGVIIKTTGSYYYVKSKKSSKTYQCTIKGKFKIQNFKATNPATVGDVVSFETGKANNHIICKIHPRKNYIIRKASKLSKESQILAANVDLAVLMITIKQPETSTSFIDRFLISTQAYKIPTILIINKIDAYNTPELLKKLQNYIHIYQTATYKCVQISAKENYNLDKLATFFEDKITLLAGHSGVGKSTLINKLNPSLNLKIQNISSYHQTGKHTTTFAEMFPLPYGGYIIDTPGIRGYGIIDIKKEELYHFFPEIFSHSKDCKYHNCLHYKEPFCAVKKAAKEGTIAKSRYQNYITILLDKETKYRMN